MSIRTDCIRRPASPVARTFVPQGGVPYRVRDGDSWISVAQAHGMQPWALIRFNYPNLPASEASAALEVNWYLQEYVGCRTLTADRKNYLFTASAAPGTIYVPGPQPPPVPPQPQPVTANFGRSRQVIPFMYREMITNAASQDTAQMRAMNTYNPANDGFFGGEPGESAARGGAVIGQQLAAALRWRDLVRTNGPWDHKPILRRMLGLGPDFHFPIEGDPDHEWYYDIWSNMHYGYVGRAAGFTGSILQWGAARGGAAGRNDPVDVETVQIGIDLWDRHGANMTQQQFHQAILDRGARIRQLQTTAEYRTAVGSATFNHIEPLTNGQ